MLFVYVVCIPGVVPKIISPWDYESISDSDPLCVIFQLLFNVSLLKTPVLTIITSKPPSFLTQSALSYVTEIHTVYGLFGSY